MKTYKCGHPVASMAGYDVPLYPGIKTNVPCTQCLRDAVVARAAAHAEEYGLPSLVGAPSEIRMAMRIRHRALAEMEVQLAEIKVRASSPRRVTPPGVLPGQVEMFSTSQAEYAVLRDKMISGLALLGTETSADWWIANRSPSAWNWLAAIMEKHNSTEKHNSKECEK